jgi:malate dehydrogenase
LTTSSFAEKVIRAVKGEKGLVEPSFVYLPGVPGGEEIAKEIGCDFFSVPIELGVSSRYQTFLNVTERKTARRYREGNQCAHEHRRKREDSA